MNLNQLSVYFYVRKSTVPGKRGTFNVRVTVNGQMLVASVKSLPLLPEEFDAKRQAPKKNSEFYIPCENFMMGMRQEISRIYNEYEKKQFIFNKSHLIKAVQSVDFRLKYGRFADSMTLLDVFDRFIKDEEKGLGKEISLGTLNVHKRYRKIIQACLNEIGMVNMPVKDLTEKEVVQIRDILKRDFALGTAGRLFQFFAVVFEFAVKIKEINENPCKYVDRVKFSRVVDQTWLENDELQRLMSLKLTGEADKYRDAFAFCCFTGLSIGDYKLLNPKKNEYIIEKAVSPKHIVPGEIHLSGAKQMLVGKRRKTATQYRVPILPQAEEIIQKYGGIEGLPFNIPLNGKMLNTLMNMADIKKEITFQTARKTMANYLINYKMLNPYYVMEVMGWKNIKESQPYTRPNNDTLTNLLLDE